MADSSGVSLRVVRRIKASRHALYAAFLDPQSVLAWLPPQGMTARLHAFDPHEGGGYRMSLTYAALGNATRGKTSADTDVVRVRFAKLVKDERIEQRVEFESEDPAFAGVMTITWTFAEVPGGTEVVVLCENAPAGISGADHRAGIASSLDNLARFAE
jgi:uncharacterized protein YndB with AHSA1/START domain